MKYLFICILNIAVTFAIYFLLGKLWFEFVASTDMPMWLKYILLI
jgi:hypothetical protein